MESPDARRTDVLFLCVANSARSQLAQGLARRLAPASVGIHSAGSEPKELNPLAVQVLAEVGIDANGLRAKTIDEVPADLIATVVTLCREEVCPVFPAGVRVLHWPLADPAAISGSEAEILKGFRATRDAIEARLRGVFVEWTHQESTRG
ncbi:MAG: arsenate reductase ArsC [bacterium]|nr:arsenate reductase ArsC [bacterium]MCP5041465.1 arsenate reductase ArsC [bacterium]